MHSIVHCTNLLLILTLSYDITLSFAQQSQQHSFLLPNHNLENVHVEENKPIGSFIHKVQAIDRANKDRKFAYYLASKHFAIDELGGEILVTGSLDRELQSEIKVVLSIVDVITRETVESKLKIIYIDDIDDSYPVFVPNKYSTHFSGPHQTDSYAYFVNVSELAAINSVVISELEVTDKDEGINGEALFECKSKLSSEAACETFSIVPRQFSKNQYSLSVRTKVALDFERIRSYQLVIGARGRRISPLTNSFLESQAVINVNVLNVQDEKPVFINSPYSLSVAEGMPKGTPVLQIIVHDGDAQDQRELSVIVLPGTFSEYFHITTGDFGEWFLETKATIDREDPVINEVSGIFTITLAAVELNGTGSSIAHESDLRNAIRDPVNGSKTLSLENVTIVVMDLPDSIPAFVRASSGKPLRENTFTFNLSESIVVGTAVPGLDLAVYDSDQGINSRFNLSLQDSDIGPQASNVFALEPDVVYGRAFIVLRILNSSALDYENPNFRSYKFNLVASKNSDPNLAKILEMQINVIDANDNSPEFDKDEYVIDVPEGTPPGTTIATINARDADSGLNGLITYMLRGIEARRFKLVVPKGQIIINGCAVAQCLDYESQPSYSLTYEARDGGGRSKNVSVVINVININDHEPKFSELVYKRELITDNFFKKRSYISPQLIIKAKDEDNLRYDKISSGIRYKLISSNLTNLDIDPTTGVVLLNDDIDIQSQIPQSSTSNGLTNDRKVIFEAEVLAEDDGEPSLNSTAKILLFVRGNREGAPAFKRDLYQVFVSENTIPNQTFFKVQATDPDGKDSELRYSLGYDLNDMIQIDPLTGELSFKTEVDYDDFKGVPYNISVIAADNAKPYPLSTSSVVSIILEDVNNKPPKFEKNLYESIITQGKSNVGDVIMKVNATDPDKNGLLKYFISDKNMSIRDRNGQFFNLSDIERIRDGYISQMSRKDIELLINSIKKLFKMRDAGSIELAAEPDYHFLSTVNLVVGVLDLNQDVTNGENQDFINCTFLLQAQVVESPTFVPPWTIKNKDYNIDILEELAIGTKVFSVIAKDPSSNTFISKYEKVYESDPKDYFKVDKHGIITVKKRIDYEEMPYPKQLSVTVRAIKDDIYSSTATVAMKVIDLNDNSPEFKNTPYNVKISEMPPYPIDFFTVSATDKDSNDQHPYGQVFYSLVGPTNNLFTIDPKKGNINVRKRVVLDREQEATHLLQVVASDCNETKTSDSYQKDHQNAICRKSYAFVSVVLQDENDNDPQFVNLNAFGEYEAVVSETAAIGTVVFQVNARDLDNDSNGQIGFEILRNDNIINQAFKIDQSGSISVARSLSGMGRRNAYKFIVRAFDNGKVSRQAQVNLMLTISDVIANDGVPRFFKPAFNETIQISENSNPNTFVYQVQAFDPDEESTNDGKLSYKFMHASNVFDINPFNGIITTKANGGDLIDREQVSNFTIIVIAQDAGQPPKQAHRVLNIQVTDMNDNEPFFLRNFDDPPVVLAVKEEIPIGSVLGSVQAIDNDIGQNAFIDYEIIDGNQNNLFRLKFDVDNSSVIGNNPCEIYSAQRLDREQKDSYTITIRATSSIKPKTSFLHHLRDSSNFRSQYYQYNATDLTKIRVQIKLLDINDNRPTFTQKNAKSVVEAGAEVYSQLMMFSANDADASSLEMHYSLLDVLYYPDAKFAKRSDDYSNNGFYYGNGNGNGIGNNNGNGLVQPTEMKHVFDIDPRSGVLRNTVSLRPYVDGYFEVFVKADSGAYNRATQLADNDDVQFNALAASANSNAASSSSAASKCYESGIQNERHKSLLSRNKTTPYAESENCFVAVAKATIFISHQREAFRFIFNKTKLNDRLDEFKEKIQKSLHELIMIEDASAVNHEKVLASSVDVLQTGQHFSQHQPHADKLYFNTFNTDYYEREDGSLDFSALAYCSQLIKFEDNDKQQQSASNQVISYNDLISMLKSLNSTASNGKDSTGNNGKSSHQATSLFAQYGLVKIERCLPDKTMYKMTLTERLSLYAAIGIALLAGLLAFIVSSMRKSYEKNLRLLQRSKYQFMTQYATLPPGLLQGAASASSLRPVHHMSMGALQTAPVNNNGGASNSGFESNFGSQYDYNEGPIYDTWQL